MSNADKAKPELILDLDKPRKFVLSLGSLRRVEEQFGKSIFKIINWQDIGVKDLTIIIWAGLLTDDPEITFEDTENLFDLDSIMRNFESLKVFISSAFERAMPALSDEDKEALEGAKKKVQNLLK